MNDLLPPARRSIPKRRRTLMREQLDAEISSATRDQRREGPVRRFGIPLAVAAIAAALALGGYVVTTDDDSGRPGEPNGDPGVAGQVGPKREGQRGPDPKTSSPVADPAQAYQQCIDLVTDWDQSIEAPVGKLAIGNGKGITVVVANGTDAYTCNIKPDSAVSPASPLDTGATRDTFAVAENGLPKRSHENGPPRRAAEMAWGGGVLPDGVSSVTYTFPDGHQEPAVTQDGFWAMQYFSLKPFADKNQSYFEIDPITVTLEGSSGTKTLTLKWGIHTCNQVSHGC